LELSSAAQVLQQGFLCSKGQLFLACKQQQLQQQHSEWSLLRRALAAVADGCCSSLVVSVLLLGIGCLLLANNSTAAL
jgi:hypothetical protein